MKDKLTTEEIFTMVSEEKSTHREFRVSPSGKNYELHVWRSALGQIWIWACKNYVKPLSKSFAYWSHTNGWKIRCKNQFVEII